MKILGTIILGFISLFYSPNNPILNQIKQTGELVVVINDGITTYYELPDGQQAGLEYELTKRFAKELGVRLKIVKTDTDKDALNQVINNEVHFAAGLVVTKNRQAKVRFTPHYQNISQQLVYHNNIRKPPTDLDNLNYGHKLNVVAKEHKIEFLQLLQQENPQLTWQELSDITSSKLAEKVWNKELKYAVFDSNAFARIRLFYPELKLAFTLPEQQYLSWAFPRSDDNSLYLAAIQFFNKLQKTGELQCLIEKYYGYAYSNENALNIKKFLRHIKERLPLYQEHFKLIANEYDLDWRLAAAIGYQESKWNPKAISGTGVKGLMMLTEMTAKEMGIEDRTDPFASIEGGTKYFYTLKQRISKQIVEPDRTWFALAAYNIGIGHVRDARKITTQQGDNPNKWSDVKQHLLKLTQPRWYKKTKYGYARGHEAVEFIENIRMFYDILVMNIV